VPVALRYSASAGCGESGCRWETALMGTKTKVVGVKLKLLDDLLTEFLKDLSLYPKKKTKLRKIK
jgi:hypothetical protein